MSNVFDSVVLDPLAVDPAAPEEGQRWANSLLGEPRVRRQGQNETLLTEPSHNPLDTLQHVLAESATIEDTFNADGCLESREVRNGGVSVRIYDTFTFDADGCLDGYRLRQFNGIGTVVQTLTVSRPGGVWTTVLS
jgi:hypothetical protein